MRVSAFTLLSVFPLLVGCGQSVSGAAAKDSGTTCSRIADAYWTALIAAMVCTPAQPDPCTAQRPILVIGPDAQGVVQHGLCWTAYVGFVDERNTGPLDALLGDFADAGCSVGVCPGPGPHPTSCQSTGGGSYVCGPG